MNVIGITGGVGSGKSAVLSYVREAYGAQVIQADLVAKQLQEKGQQVFLDIVEAFGASILAEDGSLDRAALAEIVFHDETELKLLNSIVHPAVTRRILRDIEIAKGAGCRWLFVEAALFFEAKYDAFCEEVWYIDTADEVRIRRLISSRDYTREKILRMFANQMPREEFLARCKVRIDNSGRPEETREQIDIQMKRLMTESEQK